MNQFDLTNINETRAAFSSWLAQQPNNVQVHGCHIEENLRIAATSQFDKDRAAAIAIIPRNLWWVKRALEENKMAVMPNGNPLK